jgi:Ca-activated chloride channel family protein
MKHYPLIFALALMLLGLAFPAGAQLPPVEPPIGIIPNNGVAYLKSHIVQVDIRNQVATTRLEQIFANESDILAEGTYILPLPRGATVSDLVMYVDGQPIQANILGADEARNLYEEIVRQQRDPALLEYIGQDAIQASVFPIQPRSQIKIEIEYSHILPIEAGLVRYTYPIRTNALSPRPVQTVAVSITGESAEAIGSVYSPSHPMAISREGDFKFRAGYEASYLQEASDLSLYYTLAGEEIDVNLLTYRESANEDGYFLLMIAPPSTAADAQIQPRDVLVVIDQSGSMYGEKWDQAREAAKYVLSNLNPEDRFNVVAFSTGTRIFARDLQGPAQAGAAKQWLDGLFAEGGTGIDAALRETFAQTDPARQTVVIFLTDGLATEGETNTDKLLELAKNGAPANIRIFTFGVGDDVDTLLLDSLSSQFGGTGAYVRSNERIDEEVSTLYRKIAAPVMTDINLDFGDLIAEDMYPQAPLPDLFIGSQLIIAGRYRGEGEATITLSGQVNGESRSISYSDLRFSANAGGEPTLPRLWATRKIGVLLNTIRLQGENPELVESIIRLSQRYGIITPYTYFFIDENTILAGGEGEGSMGLDTDAFRQNTGSSAVGAADTANQLSAAEQAAPAPQNVIPATSMPGGPNAPAQSFGGGNVAEQQSMNFDDESDGGVFHTSNSQGQMQVLGAKNFLQAPNSPQWVDTAYDAANMSLINITFLSEEYFALLDQYPELSDYFAIGDNLILVLGGQAYQILP